MVECIKGTGTTTIFCLDLDKTYGRHNLLSTGSGVGPRPSREWDGVILVGRKDRDPRKDTG